MVPALGDIEIDRWERWVFGGGHEQELIAALTPGSLIKRGQLHPRIFLLPYLPSHDWLSWHGFVYPECWILKPNRWESLEARTVRIQQNIRTRLEISVASVFPPEPFDNAFVCSKSSIGSTMMGGTLVGMEVHGLCWHVIILL